jgi:OOP family OmpA-OmpF porin
MDNHISILLTIGLALTSPMVAADTVSSSSIEKALSKPKTRGIGVRAKTKVDLNIPFELNSSTLKPQAVDQLQQLNAALQKDSLANYRFQIIGHTDASGSADYNRRLSRQRAESVKRFLLDAGIRADRLEVVGSGEDDLLYADRPLHGDNRRVEIRNLGRAN